MAVIIVLAALFLWISIQSSLNYFQEANQRLNAEVAAHIADDTEPFVNGELNKEALEELFHDVMVLHPSVEVYLLDPGGRILAYSAPDSLIKLDRVELSPLTAFIQSQGAAFMKGPDPRHPGESKVFSAAPVTREGEQLGYVYVILRGDNYASISDGLFKSYGFQLALKIILIALGAALVIGLLAFRMITRNLDHVIRQIRSFRVGPDQPKFRMKASGELKQLADTFNHMADTIEENIRSIREMEKSRRELVANVSHDLRTPLSTIQGYAETLLVMQDSIPEKDKEKYTRVILNSAVRLKKQVDELFELSKLENKEIRPCPEPFSIPELVLDNTQKYGVSAAERGISLKTDIRGKIPLAYADIGLMDRVLQNLLDNALKFTPGGGTITVSLCKTSGQAVRVTVEDTGLGIAPDELPTIFDRYMKVKREQADNSGAGLGLAIVKSILELHQITIQVESQVSEGSKFWFDLPVYQA